ncbi:imelysin family protein [Tenacibaculum salmonis]|uniref:imelysin family protein n=1 Tax=Tenacibaculum sp. P3-BQ1 TaxID=3232310 RepID=UPI0034E0480A
MIKKTIIITITSLLFLSCNSDSETVSSFDIQKLRTDIITNIETPITTSFIESIDDLNNSIQIFTTNPNENNLLVAKNTWKTAAKNYSLIQVLNIGEIKTSYIQTSFFSWVANAKGIEEYLLSNKEISEIAINSISTNLRGLASIEHLLFDKNTTETIEGFTDIRRKEYLNILGLNLVSKATIYNSKWNTFRTKFIENNSTGINGSINQVINQMYALLEDVKSYKIGQPAGIEKTSVPDITLLQAQKSDYSLVLIQNNIESIKNIYFGNENGIDDFVSSITKNETLNNKIKIQFETIENTISAFGNNSLKEAIINDKANVKKLYNEVKQLLVLIKTDVASVLSVTITFTDNDGD